MPSTSPLSRRRTPPSQCRSQPERSDSGPTTGRSMTVDSSPLIEVERAVQERAKDISLAMAGGDGSPKLRALIDDEVARWTDDFKRGRRSFDLADPDLVA